MSDKWSLVKCTVMLHWLTCDLIITGHRPLPQMQRLCVALYPQLLAELPVKAQPRNRVVNVKSRLPTSAPCLQRRCNIGKGLSELVHTTICAYVIHTTDQLAAAFAASSIKRTLRCPAASNAAQMPSIVRYVLLCPWAHLKALVLIQAGGHIEHRHQPVHRAAQQLGLLCRVEPHLQWSARSMSLTPLLHCNRGGLWLANTTTCSSRVSYAGGTVNDVTPHPHTWVTASAWVSSKQPHCFWVRRSQKKMRPSDPAASRLPPPPRVHAFTSLPFALYLPVHAQNVEHHIAVAVLDNHW